MEMVTTWLKKRLKNATTSWSTFIDSRHRSSKKGCSVWWELDFGIPRFSFFGFFRVGNWLFFCISIWQHTHCGWKKSCTTWDVENFANNGRLLISTGAEFLPWTVFYVYICIHLEYMQSSNQKNPQGTLLWRWWNDHGYILWGYPFQKRHMQISQKFYVQHFDSHELVHDLPR